MRQHNGTTRRDLLIGAGSVAGGIGLAGFVTVRPSQATPATMQEAIRKVIGDAQVNRGRVKIDLPPLIDNGNVVPLSVSVESPMTPENHVRAIHVFNEKNPQPNIVSVQLGPRAGRATISTRIRLADSQTVIAIAQMNDGSYWQTSQDVVVTIAACAEEIQ